MRIGRKEVNIGLAVSHFLALGLLWWCSIDVELEENRSISLLPFGIKYC
ncbi:MAG: hypothetical protein GDA56_21370 [Hormoscilla sp. GM7CHS1pb]|nr:hypothetical protein [Hormoscilla sp. GM7CHS1pb]